MSSDFQKQNQEAPIQNEQESLSIAKYYYKGGGGVGRK